MKVFLTKDELFEIIEERLNVKFGSFDIDEVAIEVETKLGLKDYITITRKNFNIGSFLKEEIKNKGE